LIQYGDEIGGKAKPMLKLDGHDPQIIPFGKVLRKTCMDELPQLFNVLRGEMSLIGPRPPLPYEVREYRLWHKERFDALPGMTGLWQVCGKNRLTFREMIRLDIRYAKRVSFPLDLVILLRTPLAILDQAWGGLNKNKDNPNGA
jgi:lipopolysaccharide/colanic/teichoic acid biosynthesis glycosyltransferase